MLSHERLRTYAPRIPTYIYLYTISGSTELGWGLPCVLLLYNVHDILTVFVQHLLDWFPNVNRLHPAPHRFSMVPEYGTSGSLHKTYIGQDDTVTTPC